MRFSLPDAFSLMLLLILLLCWRFRLSIRYMALRRHMLYAADNIRSITRRTQHHHRIADMMSHIDVVVCSHVAHTIYQHRRYANTPTSPALISSPAATPLRRYARAPPRTTSSSSPPRFGTGVAFFDADYFSLPPGCCCRHALFTLMPCFFNIFATLLTFIFALIITHIPFTSHYFSCFLMPLFSLLMMIVIR